MVIVGLKPTPQTLHKIMKSKVTASHLDHSLDTDDRSKANIEPLSGCLAWLPVMKVSHSKEVSKGIVIMTTFHSNAKFLFSRKIVKYQTPPSDPMLAFAWGNHLFILRVSVDHENKQMTVNGRMARVPTQPKSNKKGTNLQFVKAGEWKCKDAIVGIQWINKQVQSLSLFFIFFQKTGFNRSFYNRSLFYSHPMKK